MSNHKSKKRKLEQISGSVIEEFCSITGSKEDTARHFLEACDGQLDAAVTLFLDENGSNAANGRDVIVDSDSRDSASSSKKNMSDEGSSANVRAPIPQKREVLVESYLTTNSSRRRKGPRTAFDSFRDFEAEAKSRAGNINFVSKHQQNLGELFRPPIELMFKGSFHSARNVSSSDNKWLVVNVQNNEEFKCLCLNRDVWSHSDVKTIIRNHFVLWQVYHDSDSGEEYMRFYNVSQWPYIAVLDPRTGELMRTWTGVQLDATSFCELEEHPVPDEEHVNESKKAAAEKKDDRQKASVIDLSEDSQIQAAIQASLVQQTSNDYDSDDSSNGSIETFSDSDTDQQTNAKSRSGGSAHVVPKQNRTYTAASVAATVSRQTDNRVSTKASAKSNSNHKRICIDSDSESNSSVSLLSVSSSGGEDAAAAKQQPAASAMRGSDLESESVDGSETRMNWPSTSRRGAAVGRERVLPRISSLAKTPITVDDSQQSASCEIDVGTERSNASSDWFKSSGEVKKPSPVAEGGSNSCHVLSSTDDASNSINSNQQLAESSWKVFAGPDTDPKIKLLLRFPDGSKKHLDLADSSQLRAVFEFCRVHGYPMEKYDVVTHYPRRNWTTSSPEQTLRDLHLHPQETVFVQSKAND